MNRWKTVSLMLMVILVAAFAAIPAYAEDNAVIKGEVIFKGDPAKYGRTKINTGKDPNCKKSKKSIGTYKVMLNKKTAPVTVRNVLVFIREGLGDRKYDPPTEPKVLDQFGCEYKPHVLGMMDGQPLTIKNSDATNHNIHFLPKVNVEVNKTQPKKGMTATVKLVKEDVFRVKCDVHPWMGCYIAVFDHPFYDVTDKDGTFELKGLPPGKYIVEAWHETFGTLTATMELAIDETKELDFTFEPGKSDE